MHLVSSLLSLMTLHITGSSHMQDELVIATKTMNYVVKCGIPEVIVVPLLHVRTWGGEKLTSCTSPSTTTMYSCLTIWMGQKRLRSRSARRRRARS